MELYEIITKNGVTYRMNRFHQNLKNGVLEYFVDGEGHKKTKSFSVINADIPEVGELSWLSICKIHDAYGLDVSNEYAEQKVAGIVSKQYMLSKYALYSKAKELLDTIENVDSFFEILYCDYFLAMVGMYSLDVIGLDEYLDKADSDYDSTLCLYKENPTSTREYIAIKYGERYAELIDKLLIA